MGGGGLVLGLTWGWFNLDRHGGGGGLVLGLCFVGV